MEASDAIRRAYSEAYGMLSDKESMLIKASLGSDMVKAADLPPYAAERLRSRLTTDFARYRFSDAEAEGRFFDRADVQSRRAKLSLQFRLARGGATVGQSGEFSGPFSPRG